MPGKHWKKHHTNDGNEGNDEANKCEEQVDSEGGDADKVRPLMRSNCRLRQANLCLQGEDCRQCWCDGAPRGVPAKFAHRRYAAISLAKVVPLNVLAASSSTETRTSTLSMSTSGIRPSKNAETATSADATDEKDEQRKMKNKKAARTRRDRLKYLENEASACPKTLITCLQRNYTYTKEFHGSLATTLKKYSQVEQLASTGIIQQHDDIVHFHSERQRLRKVISTLLEDVGRMDNARLQIRALLRTVMGIPLSATLTAEEVGQEASLMDDEAVSDEELRSDSQTGIAPSSLHPIYFEISGAMATCRKCGVHLPYDSFYPLELSTHLQSAHEELWNDASPM
ncbi:hypothetical protein AAVH_26760 [Aphelenchoides avenae]|nr:hypothetical protein AAVH_26760 [Aphelenchus avenae]